MRTYGYARVSTRDQNLDRQLDALKERDISRKRIYIDKMSGKDFRRPQYQKMLGKLKKGDLLIIMSIDRLGRNYEEILEQWKLITKEKEVNIEVIDMPLLNTSETREGLTGMFIADLVLQVLAYVAEIERTFIKQRQAEGIAAAKRRGVKFGASRTEDPKELSEFCKKWHRGEVTIREAAATLGVSNSLFYRRCKEWKAEEDCFLN